LLKLFLLDGWIKLSLEGLRREIHALLLRAVFINETVKLLMPPPPSRCNNLRHQLIMLARNLILDVPANLILILTQLLLMAVISSIAGFKVVLLESLERGNAV
jgi:hypothetical protein